MVRGRCGARGPGAVPHAVTGQQRGIEHVTTPSLSLEGNPVPGWRLKKLYVFQLTVQVKINFCLQNIQWRPLHVHEYTFVFPYSLKAY